MNLGIWEAKNHRRCSMHYNCKNIATHYIGDKSKPQDPHNYYLCDEHLKLISDLLNINVEPQNTALNEQTNDNGISHQELIKSYLNALYDNNGMLSKAKLIEFCKEHKIELPDKPEELNTKGFLEIIFPTLKK